MRNRGGDGWLAGRSGVGPRARAHPVVDEDLRCPVGLTGVEGSARRVHAGPDAIGRVRRPRNFVDEREQHRLEQGERADTVWLGHGCDQRDRGAVRMPDEGEGIAGALKDRLQERDLVAQRDPTIRRPLGALPGAIGVSGQYVVLGSKRLHQATPLD